MSLEEAERQMHSRGVRLNADSKLGALAARGVQSSS